MDEKLIEQVRRHTALYDLENSKYSDSNFKDKIWSEISKELNVPVSIVKNRWTSLRDQYRNHQRKLRTKSGQAAATIRKWRYHEEMSFLLPFMRPRNTISNLPSEEDDIVQGTMDESENSVPGVEENENEGGVSVPAKSVETDLFHGHLGGRKRDAKKRKSQDETAASVLMKYLISQQEAEKMQCPAAKDPTDVFFAGIAEKVKRFSPYYRNITESKIFGIVQQMELEQISQQQQQLEAPNTIGHQSYPNCNNPQLVAIK